MSWLRGESDGTYAGAYSLPINITAWKVGDKYKLFRRPLSTMVEIRKDRSKPVV